MAFDNKKAQMDQKDSSPQILKIATPKHVNKSPSLDIQVTHRDKTLFLMWHTKLGHKPF